MDNKEVTPMDILVEPRKFVCPDGFEKAGLEGLCSEDFENDHNELWLIEVPVETNILDFHRQKIELSGTTKVELNSENYEFSVAENITNELAEFHLVVPSSTENRLRAVSKPFQGHIKITKSFNFPDPSFALESPVKGYPMPIGLKQRYKAFGSDEPYEAPEEPRKHKSKKKRKDRRSECEAIDVEFIKTEEKMDSDSDISKMSSKKKKKKKKHKSHKSNDSDSQKCDFDENQNSILSVEPKDNSASSSALHSRKAKKKKKKVKTEEMSE